MNIVELSRLRDRGGNVTRYFYNGNRQLRLVRNALSEDVIYEYCRCGHLKSIVDERGYETKWKFDLNGRVIEKIYHDQKSTVYTYQLESGLLSTVKFAKDTTVTLTQTYDHNGNLTSIVYSGGSRRLMTWDGINRLKQLTIQAGATQATGDKRVVWTYNADSQRATETHQTFNGTSWTINTTYYFIWEDGRIVQRRDNGTSAYICTNYYPEGEIRCYAGTTSKYYHTHDHLGSVYELTTTAGAVQAAYSFTPYGERSKRWGGAGTDIAYTGHWNLKPSSASHPAASELSLTWFRAYDPKRGVWLSRDPIEEAGGLNLYSYVEAKPIHFTDNMGLYPNAPNNVNPLRPPYDPRRPPLKGAARECIYKRRLLRQVGNVCTYGWGILVHDHSPDCSCDKVLRYNVTLPLWRWPSHHYNIRQGRCIDEISEGDRPIFR